jgi:hypothetical protein
MLQGCIAKTTRRVMHKKNTEGINNGIKLLAYVESNTSTSHAFMKKTIKE